MSKNKIPVTQSLMKAVREYLDGKGCGIILLEKYINGRLFDDMSKAMKLGMWFEYVLTGAIPKNGKPPQPEYMLSKIKANKNSVVGLGVEDMLQPYRDAYENADRVKKYWSEMGLEIENALKTGLSAGLKLNKKSGEYEFEGTIDVVLVATRDLHFDTGYYLKPGDRIEVDIKYSGMLEDKWSVHGWQWTDEQKKYHGTQAKQYKFLTGLEPFFLIADPGGKYVVMFHCVVDKAGIDAHLQEGKDLYKRLMDLHSMGMLEARPEVNKCADCVLFNECKYKHTFPHPVEVTL